MVLEMIKDAIFSAKEEYDNNVYSWQRDAQTSLIRYAESCVNRADYCLEISEALKDPVYKTHALADFNMALSVNKFLYDTFSAANKSEIETIEKRIKDINTV
jgi:hypothetical protein